MNREKVLIVLLKNPIRGKVKTRLAESVGEDAALQIYLRLMKHTLTIADKVQAHKLILWSDYIQDGPGSLGSATHGLQQGGDLGERMAAAFRQSFNLGAQRAVIIGSDCPGINADLIEEAFDQLVRNDVVIGPACDGGYYLLGMSSFYPQLFAGKKWSTEHVYRDTLADTLRLALSASILKEMSDIDEEKDLATYPDFFTTN